MNSNSKQEASKTKESLIPTATPFVLPLFLFLIVASLKLEFLDEFLGSTDDVADGAEAAVSSETWQHLIKLGVQIALSVGLLIFFRKVYIQHFPIRISWQSIVVGAVGVVVWVGVCQLGLEPQFLTWIGFDVSRPSINPFTIPDDGVRIAFLMLRFTLLAFVVPIIEELFLRGWLIRWVEDPDFESVKLTGLSRNALLTPCVYGVLTHPNEAIAAVLWFGLVTWMMNRTGNFWDCVVAHAVTNLLLGIYIVQFEQWHLW